MQHLSTTLLAACVLAGPTLGDDFEESLAAAIEAYRAGDITGAKEEIGSAAQLLVEVDAATLNACLPTDFGNWVAECSGPVQTSGAPGGGQMVSARYRRDDEEIEVQFMAGNQMVGAMAAMFANPAILASVGEVTRLGGVKAVITPDEEIQAMAAKVMIRLGGTAGLSAKKAFFAALDTQTLSEV